jgi:hypothetical protein
MSELVVNNPNILVDSPSFVIGSRPAGHGARTHTENEMAVLRQLRQIRREIDETVCSATWAEDCLYRGADYSPDFRCSCPVCRNLFPNRRHPRPVRESQYSLDCQIEADEDPEFAEEFTRLRNDRLRFGSVFIGRSSRRGSGAGGE